MVVQFTRSSSNSDFRVSEMNSVKLPFLKHESGVESQPDRQTAASFRSVQVAWTVLPHP